MDPEVIIQASDIIADILLATQPYTIETRQDITYLETADLDLYMPTTAVDMKDLFTIDAVTYEVVDVQDWNFGFHVWAPGIQVALKKWEG